MQQCLLYNFSLVISRYPKQVAEIQTQTSESIFALSTRPKFIRGTAWLNPSKKTILSAPAFSTKNSINPKEITSPAHSSIRLCILSIGYRGVASGKPPSTGIVAPVVGVWRVTKKSTALATCCAVTLALSKLRLR